MLKKDPMPATAFDTLAFAKRLQDGGFTAQQAEVLAQAQVELLEQNLATKLDLKEVERTITEVEANLRRDMKELEANLRRDVKELEANLRRDMKELEARLTRDIKELDTKVARDLKDLEYRMVIKLGSLMLAGITIMATLVKLL
jgi:predicted phage-related endonuclease